MFKNRAMRLASHRVFLRECTQAMEWGLEACCLSENDLRRLESEERHYMMLICRWNRYAPYVPGRTASYHTLLQFWDLHPLRRRLRYTRLKFVWRVLHAEPRLARAILLGVFSFESERRRSDWDRMLEEDLQLLSLSRGVERTRAGWFSYMREHTYEQWSKTASGVLTLTAVLPRPEVIPAARFQCSTCRADFPTHALLVRHRTEAHGLVDEARAYWSRNRGECPFCRCFCREGTGHNTSTLHFTATPTNGAWRHCHDAYVCLLYTSPSPRDA